MSKSLKRVVKALAAAGIDAEVLEMPNGTRTAADAAREAGCELNQIAKSIIFQGSASDALYLFITAGGNTVDPRKASDLAGEALKRADASFVRKVTGFAIGGVAPLGHLHPPRTFWDPTLDKFTIIYAAAGTPRHIFPANPQKLRQEIDAQLSDFI